MRHAYQVCGQPWIVVVTLGGDQPSLRKRFSTYLWISAVGNVVALVVIPLLGSLSDQIGRRLLFMAGARGAGMLTFPYLYAVHEHSAGLVFALSILR
ncbi:MAG: hypothetical protein JO023_29890 [Chloroflexi bacterium]|nr:hypothetical protein [Chloroflexota bacterium]